MKTFFLVVLFISQSVLADKVSFKKKDITVGTKKIKVEIAETVEELQEGLMFRKHLNKNSGMLFVFDEERPLAFWMKNTLIDLSIGFFNKNGILIDIQEMKSLKDSTSESIPTYVSKFPAKVALEMNKGWFQKNKIKLGTKIRF